jgi:hypothetical protein
VEDASLPLVQSLADIPEVKIISEEEVYEIPAFN